MPTEAHEVVTLDGRIGGIATLMPNVDVPGLLLIASSLNRHAFHMRGMLSRVVVDVFCGMRGVVVDVPGMRPVVILGMPRSVRVGANGAGKSKRKRRHGCNQPCQPCLAHAAHVGPMITDVSRLMAVICANIKTKACETIFRRSATLLQITKRGGESLPATGSPDWQA